MSSQLPSVGHDCGKPFKNPLPEQFFSDYVMMSTNLLPRRGGARQLSLLLSSLLLAGTNFPVLMAHRPKTASPANILVPRCLCGI